MLAAYKKLTFLIFAVVFLSLSVHSANSEETARNELLQKYSSTIETLAKRLQEHGVAAAPVLHVPDLLDDRHYKERGTFVEVEHPLGFKETIYGAYVKTTGAPPDVKTGPIMGRDNEYVFKDLMGIPEARYRALIEDEIIL